MTHRPIHTSVPSSCRGRLIRGVVAICAALAAAHATAAPGSIAVPDCTLIDDNAMYNDAAVNREQQARLGLISNDLRSQLGVDRVGICWVQKVSNLILNINLRIEDVASGATVFQRSVDIRGNNDLSWQRGMNALVGLVADDGGNAR